MKSLLRSILFFLFTLLGLPLWAQEDEFRVPDSLLVALEQNPKSDMNRVEALANIIDYYKKNGQHKETEQYVNEIESISQKMDNDYVNALLAFYKGSLSLNKNEFKDSYYFLSKGYGIVLKIAENEKTLRLNVRILNTLGALYIVKKMYAESYEFLSKGLDLSSKTNDLYLNSIVEINMANILNRLDRYDEAISLCCKVLKEQTITKSNQHVVYSILANSYKYRNSYDTAFMYYDSAFATSATRNDEASCLTDKALLYFSIENDTEAKRVFEHILNYYRNDLPKDAEILTLNHYGYLVGLKSKSDSAIMYIDSAILEARENHLLSLELSCYQNKSELLRQYGDYQGFDKSISNYIALRDSLDAVNDQQRLEKAWLSNEFKKTEEQLRLEKELSDAKNQKDRIRLYLIIISLSSIMLILVLAFNRRNILIKNKDMELKSKDIELKNVDMELKNKQLKEAMLTKEIEARNRELTAKALVQVERQELLTEMIEKLKAIVDDKRKLSQNLNEVIGSFEKYKSSATPEDFDYYFTQTNPDFYKHLLADFPNLTPYEQRLCAFLRLNLNTKDIAAICNISPDSAKVARARLRKSLNLVGSDADLTEFMSKY